MIRALPVCAVVMMLLLAGRTNGQAEPTETVIRLAVQPAAEPKPALRYQLLPELAEMEPGNAVPGYMKCFAEQNHLFFNKEVAEQREKWTSMPLKELPVKELRDYGGVAVRQANYAARLEHADWQTLIPLRRQGFSLLVPEVQQMRSLATVLQVRMRGAIAERRFDDAMVIAKTLLALARHLGEHPTLVGDLVGLAAAGRALDGVSEMIEQPGCPNLYWALTALPEPLIDFRKGAQGERAVLANELPPTGVRQPMTEAEMQQVVKRAQELRDLTSPPKEPRLDVQAWLAERTANEAGVAAARKRLIDDFGLSAEAVKRFPPLQVILLDQKYLYEVERDAGQKLLSLPYWQAQALIAGQPAPRAADRKSLYASVLPYYPRLHMAQARVTQRIGLLRCVEGLRLYAAAHDGKLPAKLADVPVPLPVDPVTGRPYVYSLEDGTATVRGTPPAGMEKTAVYNVRYEITIAK